MVADWLTKKQKNSEIPGHQRNEHFDFAAFHGKLMVAKVLFLPFFTSFLLRHHGFFR